MGINTLVIQMVAYLITMLATVGIIAFVQSGFFWSFLKVKMSMGRKILVKSRTATHDDYAVGYVEDGTLKFVINKNNKTINLPDNHKAFYRSIGVLWVDVDEETNNICSIDYSVQPGFDAIKMDNLIKRALQKPLEKGNFERVVVLLLLGILAASAFGAYLAYMNSEAILNIQNTLPTITSQLQGVVTQGSGGV